MHGQRVIVAILTASLWGCAVGASDEGGGNLDDAPELALAEDLRIGSADDPDIGFSAISGVDVDRDGNVYVAEGREREIRVYDPDGRLLRRIGRRGSGPGEFEQTPIFGVHGDTVWTIESDRRTITLFNRAGDVLNTGLFEPVAIPLPPPGWGRGQVRPIRMLDDATFISDMTSLSFSMSDPQSGLTENDTVRVPRVRYAVTGEVIDTIGWDARPPISNTGGSQRIEVGGKRYYVPSAPSLGDRSIVLNDGRAFVEAPASADASRGVFHLTRLALMGDTVRRTAYHYTPRPFAEAFLDSLAWRSARVPGGGIRIVDGVPERPILGPDTLDAFKAIRAAMSFPSFQHPVQSFFLANDGAVWLKREAVDGAREHWLVLAPNDDVRGVVTIPAGARLRWARGDLAWLAVPDEDDIPWLVRYRIEAT